MEEFSLTNPFLAYARYSTFNQELERCRPDTARRGLLALANLLPV